MEAESRLLVAAVLWAVVLAPVIPGCSRPSGNGGEGGIAGEIIVFHAGSLSVPFQQVARAFERRHPGVHVAREAAGSRTCARKISDLGRRCDVMASADYTVIETLLVPQHASWCIKFAANEMAIVLAEGSELQQQITPRNWPPVLIREDVAFGRSDPDADPCGYRAVLTMKLAESYYDIPGLAATLLQKDHRYIRPMEVDLLALLEAGEIDCAFLYRSVARQHGLPHVRLPDEVNLGNPAMSDLYRTVSVEVSGKSPGTTVTKVGGPMLYGVTIPEGAPNRDGAIAFLRFLLDEGGGMRIMENNGQPSLVPAPTRTYDRLPPPLKRFALPAER
jgi:molybdate/tungstate transport system substrate-binding protein